MQICFPVEKNNGLESIVFGHFGSAPTFIIFNTNDKTIKNINNQDLEHEHGMCSPLKALDNEKIDAIVVGGIGAGAINKLNSLNIKIYKATKNTIKENIDFFEAGELLELSSSHACEGHSLNQSCSH